MKELSIEEKAKRYDEAIERAKNFIENGDERERTIAESIFAGLMEVSEDEKIRKEILDYIIKGSESFYDVQQYGKEKFEKWIGWLETQGNHSLTHDDENIISQLTAYFHEGKTLQNTSATYVEWLEGLKNRLEEQKGKLVLTPEAYERVLKLGEKKPAWSEEDEKLYKSALWHIKNSCGNGGKNSGEFEVYNWLKSLKDRVQPKQEWSEEDKTMMESLTALCDDKIKTTEFADVKEHAEKCKHWLKSLKK